MSWMTGLIQRSVVTLKQGFLTLTNDTDPVDCRMFRDAAGLQATHSSVLAWRIPGTGSLVGCRLWGRTESDTTEAT